MKLNEQLEKGKIVYIREPYYITEIGRAMDDQKLYRVYKDTNYWRDTKISKYTSVYLEHCIGWINKRRCFIKEDTQS